MKREKSCGAIVYRRSHGNIQILLIKHINGGHWSFPKGHVENNETEIQTAKREILEETGIEAMIDQTFRKVITYSPCKNIVKDVVYFIAKASSHELKPQPEEVSVAKWIQLEDAANKLTYENDKYLLSLAASKIKSSTL